MVNNLKKIVKEIILVVQKEHLDAMNATKKYVPCKVLFFLRNSEKLLILFKFFVLQKIWHFSEIRVRNYEYANRFFPT